MMSARRAAVLLFALAVLPSCAFTRWAGLGPAYGPDEIAPDDPADVMFAKAQRLFAAEEWSDAASAFGKVWRKHPTSELAADARFYEAESRYGQGKYHGSYELYKAYLKDHPLSPHAPLIQRRLYDVGVYTIEVGQHGFLGIFTYSDEGVEELDYLVSAFPSGDLADDALIYMADFEWRDGQSYEAISHLHDLIDGYPGSEWALEARLRLAKAYRDLNRGTAYDADALRRSAAQYRAYIDLVGSDPVRVREYAAQLETARAELAETEESLAMKGIAAADFYLRTGRSDAARNELMNVVREYPASEAAAEAKRRLGGDAPAAAPAPAPARTDDGENS